MIRSTARWGPLLLLLLGLTSACVRDLSRNGPATATPLALLTYEAPLVFPTAVVPIPTLPPELPATAIPLPSPTEPDILTPTEAVPSDAVVPEIESGVQEVPASYRLQKGEYPFCIARRFDVDPYALLRQNGLGLYQIVAPGLKLTIPQNTTFPAKRTLQKHPTTITVQSGDTIYSIACAFGAVDPLAIARANDLESPYRLKAGQRLAIP
jgi:LysM repeat protein